MNTCWNSNEIIIMIIMMMIMIIIMIMNFLARKKGPAKSSGKSEYSRVARELAN